MDGFRLLGMAIVLYTPMFSGIAKAQFTTIADTSTSIPGGTGAFATLSLGGISATGVVAFSGTGSSGQQGIYSGNGGTPTRIADLNTSIPSGFNSFQSFGSQPTISGSTVAFQGSGVSSQSGVYTGTGGNPTVVANINSSIPSGSGSFVSSSVPTIFGTTTAFYGVGSSSQQGIYRFSGGLTSRFVDLTTVTPSGGTFSSIVPSISYSGSAVAFMAATTVNTHGVFSTLGGTPTLIADNLTAIPGGSGTFGSFNIAAISSTNVVAFNGQNSSGTQQGIYVGSGSPPSKLADFNTSIPSGTGKFTSFSTLAINSNAVVFVGSGSGNQKGIYEIGTDGLGLHKLVAVGDTIGARTISDLEITGNAFALNEVAFQASFSNGTSGIFVASVPEPIWVLGIAGAFFALGRTMRSQTRDKKNLIRT